MSTNSLELHNLNLEINKVRVLDGGKCIRTLFALNLKQVVFALHEHRALHVPCRRRMRSHEPTLLKVPYTVVSEFLM